MTPEPLDAGRPTRRPRVGVMDVRPLRFGRLEEELRERAELVIEPDQQQLRGVHGLVAYQDRHLTPELLAAAERLVVVGHVGTGIHVDVDAATELGIVVLNNPGHNAISVAEHTMGLLLALAKRIPRSDQIVRRRDPWRVATPDLYNIELRGRTLGLLGFGAIGRHVAHMASVGFGMEVVVFERDLDPVVAAGHQHASLDQVLERSDVISVHLPLTPQTHHLLDASAFRRMKSSALLVHTARGEVVDYAALENALRAGEIAGAAFDTWPGHRPAPELGIIDLENVVMTQHNAGLTHESAARMADAVVAGMWDVFEGDEPAGSRIVNPEVWPRRRRIETDTDLADPA